MQKRSPGKVAGDRKHLDSDTIHLFELPSANVRPKPTWGRADDNDGVDANSGYDALSAKLLPTGRGRGQREGRAGLKGGAANKDKVGLGLTEPLFLVDSKTDAFSVPLQVEAGSCTVASSASSVTGTSRSKRRLLFPAGQRPTPVAGHSKACRHIFEPFKGPADLQNLEVHGVDSDEEDEEDHPSSTRACVSSDGDGSTSDSVVGLPGSPEMGLTITHGGSTISPTQYSGMIAHSLMGNSDGSTSDSLSSPDKSGDGWVGGEFEEFMDPHNTYDALAARHAVPESSWRTNPVAPVDVHASGSDARLLHATCANRHGALLVHFSVQLTHAFAAVSPLTADRPQVTACPWGACDVPFPRVH
jgi:hypothetical protein